MHSRDPQKNDSEFQKEFDAILKAAAASNATANFTGFVFPSANYEGREFLAKCEFVLAIFMQEANFRRASFEHEANFICVTFTQKAIFNSAMFKQEAYFHGATFTQEAGFYGARFKQEAEFSDAKFAQEADFQRAQFLASAEFRETVFREGDKLSPGPVFSMAEFSHPESVVFYKTNLGQALFHNCDVSKVTFSSVEWRMPKGGGRRMLFDEEVDLETASDLRVGRNSHDERDYGLIAELYQQLKKNYDERKDYWAAGDFHYGEMEMKRLHSCSRRPWVRWLHRNLGLVAWYKYASSYGESYLRPMLVLAIILSVFTALYPLA